jgi:uncharacterized membrane protein YcjF (UPF0283 family)
MKRKLFLLVTAIFGMVFNAAAEADKSNWLDDTFFRDGKYWVVVVVLSLIFLGIIAFVAMLERRVRKLERLQGNKDSDEAQ